MPQNKLEHLRRSIRLAGFDYSTPGAYAVTVVTQQRRCLYGEVAAGEMRLNAAGQMIEKWWRELAHKFPAVEIDIYGVMPNHFHGIIVIKESAVTKEGAHAGAPLRDDEAIVTGEGAHTGAPLHGDGVIVTGEGAHTGAPLHGDGVIVTGEGAHAGAPLQDDEAIVTSEGAHAGAPLQDGETVVTNEGAHAGAPLQDDEAIAGAGAGVSRHWRSPLPKMLQWFKTMTTNEYIHSARALGWPRFPGKLWQRGYYERVIRGPLEMDSARLYIVSNPAQWALDRENPDQARLA